MSEHKKTGILSLNVNELINLHLLWNTVGEFIFHYTINSSANLKRMFTQTW